MISFFYESIEIKLNEERLTSWLVKAIYLEEKKEGEINFIFCKDDYLIEINKEFLNHNTYTDIISFDNSLGNELHGDIYISYDRVEDNSVIYDVKVLEELKRVMIHGILHFCGYKDKTEEEKKLMRQKEDEMLKMFHVEHL